MSELNTTPETKPQPNKGEPSYLDEAQRLFPAYEAQRRREADILHDLQCRVARLETMLTARGISLDDM